MSDSGTVVLTQDILEAGRSRNGGWSDKQLKLLGVQYPLRQGWKRRLSGTRIPQSDAQAFLALKNDHLPLIPDVRDGPAGELGVDRDEPNDNVVAFVYLVLRDHLTSGALEGVLNQVLEAPQLEREYEDEFTRDHAIDAAERLLGMT